MYIKHNSRPSRLDAIYVESLALPAIKARATPPASSIFEQMLTKKNHFKRGIALITKIEKSVFTATATFT